MNVVFAAFALIVLLYINFLTHMLCQQKHIVDSHKIRVFRFINVCTTILLISSYVEVIYHTIK
jgi:hypothetical protein